MEKKATLGITLALLLISMLTFNIQPVRASGTIHIRPDGSVEGTDKIQKDGDVYTFTDSIDDEIVVQRSNIIIDGAGYTLLGPGALLDEYGFSLSEVSNVTIKGTIIKDWSRGIDLYHSSGNNLSGNHITNNYRGVYSEWSSNNYISENSIEHNGYDGVALWSSNNNIVHRNHITNNTYYGIVLGWSSGNIISGNNATSHNEGYGIILSSESSNNGLYDNNIKSNKWGGVAIYLSNYNTLSRNKVDSNEWDGIWIGYSYYNILTGNNVSNNCNGIGLGYSSSNTITDSYIYMNNEYGIRLDGSSDNTFRNNNITGSDIGLDVNGNILSHFIHDIDTSNTVAGMPIYYMINENNLIIDTSGMGQLVLVNSTYITVRNLNFTKKGQGVLLAYTHHSIVDSGNFSNLRSSITLKYSANNTISKNTITNGTDPSYGSIQLYYSEQNKIEQNVFQNQRTGVFLTHSQNNVLNENKMYSNRGAGIDLEWNCSGNTIAGNIISNSMDGIVIFGFPDTYPSDNNIILNNEFNGSEHGIGLSGSNTNLISGNIISNNRHGIYVTSSNDNRIFHNNFIDNEYQTFSGDSFNTWDDGYPSGGNYWGDYIDVDLFSGPYQNITGGDGIWDHPYLIDANNQDNYPLVEPWSPYPMTIDELKTKIEEFGFEGEIDNQGIVRSLIAKLDTVQKLVDKGKIDEARNTLEEDFIPQVQNLSGIHITVEAADIIIKSAEYILSHL